MDSKTKVRLDNTAIAQIMNGAFYNLYLHTVMIVEDGPRQYDDKRSVEWARSEFMKDLRFIG